MPGSHGYDWRLTGFHGGAKSPSASSVTSARCILWRANLARPALPLSRFRAPVRGFHRLREVFERWGISGRGGGYLRKLRATLWMPVRQLVAAAPRFENGAFAELGA